MELHKIVGLKVVAVKGEVTDTKGTKFVEPKIILFDDGETYIELDEQDYYTYHDCSTSARHLRIFQDERLWSMYMSDDEYFPDANCDI